MTKVTREQAREAWKWIQMMIETNYDTAAQKRLDQFFSQTCETCLHYKNDCFNTYPANLAGCEKGWEPKA